VTVLEFFDFFLNKNFVTCQANIVSRGTTVTVWCGSDSITCHYYFTCHFLILNLVLIFVKIVQFRSLPNWNKN